jgi:hypothetical protein
VRTKSQTVIKYKNFENSTEILKYEKIKKDSIMLMDKINALRDIYLENIAKVRIRDQYIRKLKTKLVNKSFISTMPSQYDTKLLSEYVPRWVPDDSVKACTLCERVFSLFNRKHHCRACGDIFCSKCCYRYETFAPFYKTKVRVCESCFKDKKYIC